MFCLDLALMGHDVFIAIYHSALYKNVNADGCPMRIMEFSQAEYVILNRNINVMGSSFSCSISCS